jgi:hypothetical protein
MCPLLFSAGVLTTSPWNSIDYEELSTTTFTNEWSKNSVVGFFVLFVYSIPVSLRVNVVMFMCFYAALVLYCFVCFGFFSSGK